MSSNQVISYADLSVINSALRSISSDMGGVHSELGTLNSKQHVLESEIGKLAKAFADFVNSDKKQKTLQLAETRVGNLTQEMEIKFGYYSEVRRMATGILQGVDAGIVSDNTLQFTTEEVMVKAPGYWLAPALVALASWIRNDKNTTEKALQEALKRDDYKTTLFFMLVMRRLARNEASLKWLERYFMHQNPQKLSREFITVLEAITTGVFQPAARNLLMSNVKNWLQLLTKSDTFINDQKKQWVGFFETFGQSTAGKYPLLEQYATNWSVLNQSLKEANAHTHINDHFKGIISSSADFSKSVKVQLDEILSLLVTNFDDEELPLHEQVRLNQLIVEKDGDKDAATAVLDTEKHIFEEEGDFLQLLTNASFNPELAGATKVTQALAVSIGQPWITEAYDSFTAQSRNRIPQTVELTIDGFNAATANGHDENELLNKQQEYYDNLLKIELEHAPKPILAFLIGGLIGIGGISALTSNIARGVVILLIGAAIVFYFMNKYKNSKQGIIELVEERKRSANEVLRGCIAEVVDYRKDHAAEDANAEVVRASLAAIKPEDFSSVSKDAARSFVNN